MKMPPGPPDAQRVIVVIHLLVVRRSVPKIFVVELTLSVTYINLYGKDQTLTITARAVTKR